jgi:outer membrane protein assembly factor BamB
MVGAVSGQGNARWAVFFGDGHANVFALDAQTGRQLWKTRVDDHVVARITGSVKYHDGRVYVPISGSEEFNSGNKDYPCCTARGWSRGARREHREGTLEDVSRRAGEAVEEAGERCTTLWTGNWRGLEFADDRSRSRRALRRHGRCGDSTGIATHRCRDRT